MPRHFLHDSVAGRPKLSLEKSYASCPSSHKVLLPSSIPIPTPSSPSPSASIHYLSSFSWVSSRCFITPHTYHASLKVGKKRTSTRTALDLRPILTHLPGSRYASSSLFRFQITNRLVSRLFVQERLRRWRREDQGPSHWYRLGNHKLGRRSHGGQDA